MGDVVVHILLLSVDCFDCGKFLFIFLRQLLSAGNHLFNAADVSFEIAKLFTDNFARLFFLAVLDVGSVVFMRLFAICARLLLTFFMQIVDDFLAALTCFVEPGVCGNIPSRTDQTAVYCHHRLSSCRSIEDTDSPEFKRYFGIGAAVLRLNNSRT